MVKFFLSWRYIRAHRIIYFSILGIAIGITVLIIVTGVMNGFVRDLRSRIKGMQSHITVFDSQDLPIARPFEVVRECEKVEGVTHASPRIIWPVMAGHQGVVLSNRLFTLVGIDLKSEQSYGELPAYFARGGKRGFSFDYDDAARKPKLPPVVAGWDTSFQIGDTVSVMAFRTTEGGKDYRYSEQRFEVVGRFRTGMSEYDSTMVFTTLDHARPILEGETSASSDPMVNRIAVTIDERYDVNDVKDRLRGHLGFAYYARTWVKEKSNYMAAVEISKVIQIIILVMIVIVAGFNVIAVFTLMVQSKVKDIGILRSLGTTGGGIVSIFLISGFICGTLGSILGVGLGMAIGPNLAWITDHLGSLIGVDLFPRSIYFLDSVPFAIDVFSVGLIVVCTMGVSLFFSIYPAIRAARYDPIEAIRYQ